MKQNDLAAACAATAEARTKQEARAAAHERGRQAHAAAVAERQRLEAVRGEWLAREGRRRAAAHADGQTRPQLVADPEAQQALANALDNERAEAAALAQLMADEAIAREERAASERHERQIRDDLRRVEVDRIAARVAALRGEEYRLCAALAVVDLDSSGALLTARGLDVLQNPRARPSAESFFGRGVAADTLSHVGGDLAALAAAREFWREFDAWLDGASAPAAERAA